MSTTLSPDSVGSFMSRMRIDRRTVDVDATRADVFCTVCRLGGSNGWYGPRVLWETRGILDRMVGGPGMRRRRVHPDLLTLGDPVDFWRVSAIERDRSVVLRAEMKLPGEAELEFTIDEIATPETPPPAAARVRLTQTARFWPHGFAGLAYWYLIAPLHEVVFGRMIDGIARAAEAGLVGPP